MPPDDRYEYDLFLSYDQADHWALAWLLPRLEAAGLRVCVDRRDFAIGRLKVVNREQAVAQSRHTLLVLTPQYLGGEWTAFEGALAQSLDPSGLQQRLMPLLREPCPLPRRIAMVEAADFTDPAAWDDEVRRLVRSLGGDTQAFAKTASSTLPPPLDGQTINQAPGATQPVQETRKIGDALDALSVLLENPVIHAAVASGRDLFAEVLRQITTLGLYKGLHDRFQQMEERAQIVDGFRPQLTAQETQAWHLFERSEADLREQIAEVLALAAKLDARAHWLQKLDRAKREMLGGIDQRDPALISRALRSVFAILGQEPWSINVQLAEVARNLPLHALARKLSTVADELTRLELELWQRRQYAIFADGVGEISQLDTQLVRLVSWHDRFQELDNELRQAEGYLDGSGQGLADLWAEIEPLHRQICDAGNTMSWALRLAHTAAELEQCLLARPGDRSALRLFWSYRAQCNRSFTQVDTDLLQLCGELQRIGRSLEFVLQVSA